MIGRVVSVGSLTVVVVSLGTGASSHPVSSQTIAHTDVSRPGLYILSTTYGAYAVREFLGAE